MSKNILVLYGGVSPEHEVSIVSALQVMNALKEAGHKVLGGYVSKKGEWFLGMDNFLKPECYRDLNKFVRSGKKMILPASRELGLLTRDWFSFGGERVQPEVIFPVFHGRNGEDGTVQGLLELFNLPYVGCRVTASALGMDKYLTKRVAEAIGLAVVDDYLVTKNSWEKSKQKDLSEIKKLGEKLFVKPANLGSSIGITKVNQASEIENAVEVALCYDERVLVEKAVEKPIEINISIMGNDPYELSITEQPISSDELLSFKDKYLSGEGMASLSRLMPAQVEAGTIREVEKAAEKFFRAIGGKGIARIDFMMDQNNKLYFNEINTMPGSIAFYLWETTPQATQAGGQGKYKITELVDKLVDLAVADWESRKSLVSTFESNILANFASNNLKGGKV